MKITAFAALGLLTLLATATAFGQPRMQADIPFAFRVGTVPMPAGHYEVSQAFAGVKGQLYIGCTTCKAKAIALGDNVGSYEASTAPRLVFNRYGQSYFLSQVWSDNGPGNVLHQSAAEKELARMASVPRETQVVLARR